ncbi:putative myosin heavy chain MYA2-related [Trypanosoma rangeli]|uniref:Putative myosin heavy chain MYA2-related n=1 Tax=Trypanosoma rangeli TaxID=5698 RepID=A0A422NHX2_TRYRA|nr:putative myosin heavy chain MYA2-related [Trypanosoma rangeli]RNF05057.1 putative myosin heavy chain MYA2-related [Trypanosoma rangeli]|eukprot:RNF05057.1 putative myosin heavy chain MYA2-related [Trypanosoma rangeli]
MCNCGDQRKRFHTNASGVGGGACFALPPTVDVLTIVDVVAALLKCDESVEATAEFRQQCVDDGSLALTLTRVMSEAEVRLAVVRSLLDGDVTTPARLLQCEHAELKQFGMTDVEVAAVTRAALKVESARVKLERLQSRIGTR